MYESNEAYQRTSTERYFYVMYEGWYLKAREGQQGPFLSRKNADRYLGMLMRSHHLKRSSLWDEQAEH